ncbi:MAG: hypothetical protein WB676_01840 [Bryobacteraceae bacterium]
MCDYSLMMVPNRLAIEGEELVAHRFQSGSLGLVSCFDYDSWSRQRSKSIWQRFKAWCSSDSEPTPVVCIPPGARLRLDGLPEIFKDQFDLSSSEEATFTELSAEANRHRDALCFNNSAILLLELLAEGQRVKVLRLSSLERRRARSGPDPSRTHGMKPGTAVEGSRLLRSGLSDVFLGETVDLEAPNVTPQIRVTCLIAVDAD